jgi:hypothetical protein
MEPDQDEVAAAWTEDAGDEGVTAMARSMQSRATASVGKELGEGKAEANQDEGGWPERGQNEAERRGIPR